MLIWNSFMKVNINSFSERHIDASIQDNRGDWRFTSFYGNPETEKRRFSWELLDRLYEENERPWLIGGDFNEILSVEEKKRRNG